MYGEDSSHFGDIASFGGKDQHIFIISSHSLMSSSGGILKILATRVKYSMRFRSSGVISSKFEAMPHSKPVQSVICQQLLRRSPEEQRPDHLPRPDGES